MNQEDIWNPIRMLAQILAINGVSAFLSAARSKTVSPSPERDDWHVLLTAIEGIDGGCLGSAIDSARPVIVKLRTHDEESVRFLGSKEDLRNEWFDSARNLREICVVVVPWAELREMNKYRMNDGVIHPCSAAIAKGTLMSGGWRLALSEQRIDVDKKQREDLVKTIRDLSLVIREGYADDSLPGNVSVYEFDTEAKRLFKIDERLSECEKDLERRRDELEVLRSEYLDKTGELLDLLAALPRDALLAIRRVMGNAPQG